MENNNSVMISSSNKIDESKKKNTVDASADAVTAGTTGTGKRSLSLSFVTLTSDQFSSSSSSSFALSSMLSIPDTPSILVGGGDAPRWLLVLVLVVQSYS